MKSAAFLRMIKQKTRAVDAGNDPLKEARRFIQKHGSTGEGKAMRAVIEALWKGEGEFAESDIWCLSDKSLAVLSALIDARFENRYAEWEWHLASCYPAWRFLLDLHKRLEK